MKQLWSYVAKIFILVVLVAIGVGLYFLREKKMPSPIGHETTVTAKKSTQRIIADEFLIMVSPHNLDKLDQILSPLALEPKFPILNWLLVKKIRHGGKDIIPVSSEHALEASQLLNSLLQHPYVLDAQHNYVLDTATTPETIERSAKEKFDLTQTTAPGQKDVVIGVVDQFRVNGHVTFKERFSECLKRVEFFSPNLGEIASLEFGTVPHGEIMLLALGACSTNQENSDGINGGAHLLAIERPSLGHAQTFLALLLASQINPCEQLNVACPKNIARGVREKKPDVVLLPFGGDAPELLQFTTDMIDALHQKNIVVVTAAGNDHAHAQNYFPGGSPVVINVGALGKNGKLAAFSNWGPPIDLLAPGADIEFHYPNGPKSIFGTSIAASFVTGAVALMKSKNLELLHPALEFMLTESAKTLPCESYCTMKNSDCQKLCCDASRKTCGKLALDVSAAITMAKEKKPLPPLLDLSSHYILFLRDEELTKNIQITNVGNMDATVTAESFDDNVILPKELTLGKKGSETATSPLTFSLKKEPYRRQTYKVAVKATLGDRITDQEEFYIEYIPKK